MLPRVPGRPAGPLASAGTVRRRSTSTSDPATPGGLGALPHRHRPDVGRRRQRRPELRLGGVGVPSEGSVFTLNSAIAAVSEGNYGRLAADQQGVYTDGNARSQLDPDLWEMPGAMPEIVPGGDFGANIEQAAYRALDGHAGLGRLRRALAGRPPVAGRLPRSRSRARGRRAPAPARSAPASGPRIRLGGTSIDVAASPGLDLHDQGHPAVGRLTLTIGAVLPNGAKIASAPLNGRSVTPRLVPTSRGLEVQVPRQRTAAGPAGGHHPADLSLGRRARQPTVRTPRSTTWRGVRSTPRSSRGSASKTTRSAGAPSTSASGRPSQARARQEPGPQRVRRSS